MANNKYDLGEAFKIIEDELIDSMMRNLERHKEWETDEGFDWNAWQSEQLKSLEEYRLKNRKKFSKKFQDINKKIPELINWAREQGGADAEADLLANIGKNRKTSQGVGIDFFRLNNRKMDALVNATTNDFERAEYAVLRRADDEYRQIIYNSQVYANSGAGTYAQAVDMATKDFLSRGIQCIEYANGSRHTISDYADMAIKTANKRAYLAGEGERRAEWGEHLVIVNKRTDACPKCMKFEGRVFIDDVYSGGTPEDGDYPLLSDAMEQGLYHPRCRDSHSTYYEGISTPPSRPTRADFDRAVEIEEQETRLATAQRNVERYDRLAKYSLDPQNKQRYEARAEEWRGLGACIGGEGLVKLHQEPEQLRSIIPTVENALAVIQSFESRMRNFKIERAMVATVDGEIFVCSGVEDRVFPDYDLGDKIRGAIVTHNHIEMYTEFSFSFDDFDFFRDNDIQILRGKDHKYTYQLSRLDDEVIDDVQTKDVRVWDDEETCQHLQIIELAKQYGFGYKRWLNE